MIRQTISIVQELIRIFEADASIPNIEREYFPRTRHSFAIETVRGVDFEVAYQFLKHKGNITVNSSLGVECIISDTFSIAVTNNHGSPRIVVSPCFQGVKVYTYSWSHVIGSGGSGSSTPMEVDIPSIINELVSTVNPKYIRQLLDYGVFVKDEPEVTVFATKFKRESSSDWELGVRMQSSDGEADHILDKRGRTVDEPYDIHDVHHKGSFKL